MYTYKRAVGINQLTPKGEELLDISTTPTKDLFVTYSQLTIVVEDSFAQRDVAINLEYYRNELSAFSGTIQEWLDTKTTVNLISSNTLPGAVYRYVTLHNLQHEWFTPVPGDIRIAMDRQDQLTKTNAPDIRLKKTDNTAVDYKALQKRCLFLVNNHLVRSIAGEDCLFLLNAGKHFNVNDNTHFACLNFNTVSTLNTYPITDDQIEFTGKETYTHLRLSTPMDLLGKTVWMSIGGRLYREDVIQVNGLKGLTIRVDKVDWFSRIFESKKWIDLERVINKEREVVGKDFFTKEAFFRDLLKDPSSFLIVLDNPHLYTWMDPIATYRYPFTFNTHETRKIPLMVSSGLLPWYHQRKIINRRLLDIDIGVNTKYLNETTGIGNGGDLYHGFTNRFKPSTLQKGYLLYIRGLIQEN